MTRKHFKTYYSLPENEIDNGFDDRTLAHLINSMSGGRPTLPCDGRNEDQPYKTLPLERWKDR